MHLTEHEIVLINLMTALLNSLRLPKTSAAAGAPASATTVAAADADAGAGLTAAEADVPYDDDLDRMDSVAMLALREVVAGTDASSVHLVVSVVFQYVQRCGTGECYRRRRRGRRRHAGLSTVRPRSFSLCVGTRKMYPVHVLSPHCVHSRPCITPGSVGSTNVVTGVTQPRPCTSSACS